MLELPQWAHELATFSTLALAAAWLIAHLSRIARERAGDSSCTRCEYNAGAPVPALAPARRGRRSRQLRVLK